MRERERGWGGGGRREGGREGGREREMDGGREGWRERERGGGGNDNDHHYLRSKIMRLP